MKKMQIKCKTSMLTNNHRALKGAFFVPLVNIVVITFSVGISPEPASLLGVIPFGLLHRTSLTIGVGEGSTVPADAKG